MGSKVDPLVATEVSVAALSSPVAFRVEAEGQHGNFRGYREGGILPRNPSEQRQKPCIQEFILHMWYKKRQSSLVSVTKSWAEANRLAEGFRKKGSTKIYIYVIDLGAITHTAYDAFKLAELFKCEGGRLEHHRHELLLHNGLDRREYAVRARIHYGDLIATTAGDKAYVDFPVHPGFLRVPVSYFNKLKSFDAPAAQAAALAAACLTQDAPNAASDMARFKYMIEQDISRMIWAYPGSDPLDEKRHYKLVSDILSTMFVEEGIEVFSPLKSVPV